MIEACAPEAKPVRTDDYVAGERVERPMGLRVDMSRYRGTQTYKFGTSSVVWLHRAPHL